MTADIKGTKSSGSADIKGTPGQDDRGGATRVALQQCGCRVTLNDASALGDQRARLSKLCVKTSNLAGGARSRHSSITWFQSTSLSCSLSSPMMLCLWNLLKSKTCITTVEFRREDLEICKRMFGQQQTGFQLGRRYRQTKIHTRFKVKISDQTFSFHFGR